VKYFRISRGSMYCPDANYMCMHVHRHIYAHLHKSYLITPFLSSLQFQQFCTQKILYCIFSQDLPHIPTLCFSTKEDSCGPSIVHGYTPFWHFDKHQNQWMLHLETDGTRINPVAHKANVLEILFFLFKFIFLI
jgi:hypothetical protein